MIHSIQEDATVLGYTQNPVVFRIKKWTIKMQIKALPKSDFTAIIDSYCKPINKAAEIPWRLMRQCFCSIAASWQENQHPTITGFRAPKWATKRMYKHSIFKFKNILPYI